MLPQQKTIKHFKFNPALYYIITWIDDEEHDSSKEMGALDNYQADILWHGLHSSGISEKFIHSGTREQIEKLMESID